MRHKLPIDPILIEVVERQLAPYAKILPAEVIERFREEALAQLSQHPYPAALLYQLREPVPVQTSGDQPKDAAERVDELRAARRRGEQ